MKCFKLVGFSSSYRDISATLAESDEFDHDDDVDDDVSLVVLVYQFQHTREEQFDKGIPIEDDSEEWEHNSL